MSAAAAKRLPLSVDSLDGHQIGIASFDVLLYESLS